MLVYFPHIPKAGGQTLLQGFYRVFGFKNCLKVWNPEFGADVSPDGFSELGEEWFRDRPAVVGHLPVKKFMANSYVRERFENGDVRILTSVRQPVKRIISLYNFIVNNAQHPSHENIKDIPPARFVTRQPPNFQYNFLAPTETASLDQIFGLMNVFPVEDSINGFSDFFERHFNVNTVNLEIRNTAQEWAGDGGIITEADLDREVIEFLREKHAADFELYDRAVARSRSSGNSPGCDSEPKQNIASRYWNIFRDYIRR